MGFRGESEILSRIPNRFFMLNIVFYFWEVKQRVKIYC
ncbi:hypothetical protein D083_2582 [Dickeya solani RNS 08.23.3.1.A]|nr:hypothetical protein D083_2582 [Dickeya solani RNS 08.23.3.1.A]